MRQRVIHHVRHSDRIRRAVERYPEVIIVLVAAALGLTVPAPLRWMVDHRGIDALLVVLVFATGLTITLGDLSRVSIHRRRISLALVCGVTILPALAWVVARAVGAGPLRNGVLTIGLAPCEIASVATTTMAGGQAAVAAAVLIASTGLTVVLAGPILLLEAGHASVHPLELIVNLALIVVMPLAAGIGVRAVRRVRLEPRRRRALSANDVSTASVAALVALIASEVHPSMAYVAVLAASVAFVAASAALGLVLCRGADRTVAVPVMLTISMRDFAIAAGIAAGAFGAPAAAPLGLYGIVALVWGTVLAGFSRNRSMREAAGP